MNEHVLTTQIWNPTETFDEEVISSLQKSIEEQGVFHPIIVQEFQGPQSLGARRFNIVAGKKRFIALQRLGTREVPVKILPFNLTADQCTEIALHENIKRYNLPWYEQVQRQKELHELRQRMHGVHVNGRPKLSSKEKGWSQADTARELQLSVGAFSEDLLLANAIQRDSSLSKIKDKTTALKLVRQQAKRQIAEVESFIPADFEMNQVFLGDSLSILPQLPANLFDACITDPPWSEYARNEDLTMDSSTVEVFREVFRVLKNDSFLYLVTSITDFWMYREKLKEIGFQVQNYPIIWQKTRTITHGRRPWEYARDFEPILVGVKGSPVLVPQTEQSAILSYENLHYTKMIHPHEKPPELLQKLISDCTFEGGKVLDPFSGSGVTLETAKKMNRQFIGIERDKSFFDNVVKRLEEK